MRAFKAQILRKISAQYNEASRIEWEKWRASGYADVQARKRSINFYCKQVECATSIRLLEGRR